MNRKRANALLLAMVMVFSLAACGAKEPTEASEEPKAGEQSMEAVPAEVKDSVIIAIGSEPDTLDPTKGWGHGNAPIVQSTLVKYKADLTFKNDLATSYALSDDGLVWTFTLRDDAYFTDGEKVTASDVAFTLETAKAA